MKNSILTFILLLSFTIVFAQYNNPAQTVYEKLSNINKEWVSKNFDEPILERYTVFHSDEEVIQLHLKLVEGKLRAADTENLTDAQKANREMCLDYLKEYWQTGRFPKNTHHNIRTPYFIDDYGTACAVAHLVIESGSENLARKVQRETNYAYIREMQYPELQAWADDNGFSTDELAWIQPGYSTIPPYVWTDINAGVDGTVQTIEVDKANNILYVAADFGTAASNIRSFNGVSWSNMGGGVDGTVNEILVVNNSVYVAGNFTTAGNITVNNIARWNGSQWDSLAGGVPGVITALAMLNGELYAAGQFYYPTIFPQAVLVKWDGASWQIVLAAPNADIYDMTVLGNKELIIAGNFTYIGGINASNIAKYDDLNGLTGMGGYPSPVRTVISYNDTLFLGGDFTYNDTTYLTTGFAYWDGSQFVDMISGFAWSVPWQPQDEYYINDLWEDNGQLYISGKFDYYPMYGYSGTNAVVMSGMYSINGIAWGLDAEVNGTVLFNGQMVMGGDFTMIGGGSANRLAATGSLFTGIKNHDKVKVKVYNNPSQMAAIIEVENWQDTEQLNLTLMDVQGKTLKSFGNFNGNKKVIDKKELPAGTYVFNLFSGKERIASGKVVFL